MKYVLFDVDHTLVDVKGAGARALSWALKEIFGNGEVVGELDLAGKTDLQIVKEALSKMGVESSHGIVEKICEEYTRRLKLEMETHGGEVLPGVRELLKLLHETSGIYLGLLTGNLEEGARLKLEPFGLNGFFRVGAFGGDHEDRDQLLPIAIERLEGLEGIRPGYDECIVVGDTPRDVRCAKVHGALAIGVATGRFSMDTLAKAGTDLVLPDLRQTNMILEWIKEIPRTGPLRELG